MLRVAFLVGNDNKPTRDAMEAVCLLANVQPVLILFDEGHTPSKRRLKNFRNNIRRDGLAYPLIRILSTLRQVSDTLVERSVVKRAQVVNALRKAFPDQAFSFEDLAQRYSIELAHVPNLNGSEAVAKLASAGADLGLVLGTRVLRKNIFTVPRLGCINLHKGHVPDYRGLPPGFWELYDGVQSAGITVHFVDSGLDTGDIIATSEVPIERFDTPDTLLQKLHREGTRVVAQAVESIADNTYTRSAQPKSSRKPHTKPSRKEVETLRRKLPHWTHRSDLGVIAKNSYCLAIYWSGIYAAVRKWHRAQGDRAAVLLHHRVNDYADDVLTVDTETFTAQLLALSARYQKVDTDAIVAALIQKQPIPGASVAIHFDDCYRDVYTHGAPILKSLGFPAMFFINPGFLDTDRQFNHDREKFPFRFENLKSSELVDWKDRGFGVGAHTVNHVDLGTCTLEQARFEVVESGRRLEEILNQRVPCFSFPFGQLKNIRQDTADLIMRSDYKALFAAHGGFVNSSTSLSDIPRIGCNGEARPLYLLLELEGLAPGSLSAYVRRGKSKR